jgi:hypothetical protein
MNRRAFVTGLGAVLAAPFAAAAQHTGKVYRRARVSRPRAARAGAAATPPLLRQLARCRRHRDRDGTARVRPRAPALQRSGLARDVLPSGFEHSLTSHAGTAWARSPWEAVHRAAVDALRKLEVPDAATPDWTTTLMNPGAVTAPGRHDAAAARGRDQLTRLRRASEVDGAVRTPGEARLAPADEAVGSVRSHGNALLAAR